MEAWLAVNDTSPMTGLLLESKALVPNLNLRNEIEEYKSKHPSKRSEMEIYKTLPPRPAPPVAPPAAPPAAGGILEWVAGIVGAPGVMAAPPVVDYGAAQGPVVIAFALDQPPCLQKLFRFSSFGIRIILFWHQNARSGFLGAS
jgi:hypothetical protein